MFLLPPFKSTTSHTMCSFNVALTPAYITKETEVPACMLSIPTLSEFDQNSFCPDGKFPAARNLATASFSLVKRFCPEKRQPKKTSHSLCHLESIGKAKPRMTAGTLGLRT